jgi:hypothetical protein
MFLWSVCKIFIIMWMLLPQDSLLEARPISEL